MGVEWWGNRHGSDHDSWQANWDNQLSSEEHRAVRQGSKEDRVGGQGSEEDSRSESWRSWVKIKDELSEDELLRLSGYRSDRFEDDENGRSPNHAGDDICIDLGNVEDLDGKA